jgi:uncharacterized membrane protein
MTQEQLTSRQPITNRWDNHNVISVSFEDDHEAHHALTLLTKLDSQHRVDVQEAAVVLRGEDGRLVEQDSTVSTYLAGTASGGLMGLLLGIIGGPFGVLIGGAIGLMIGSRFDVTDYEETDSALSAVSRSVKPGRTALLAVVVEQSPEIVDSAMSRVGGVVLRRPVMVVQAEIAVAEDAELKAQEVARKELHRSRREYDKAAVTAKIEELKAKVRHGDGAHTVST